MYAFIIVLIKVIVVTLPGFLFVRWRSKKRRPGFAILLFGWAISSFYSVIAEPLSLILISIINIPVGDAYPHVFSFLAGIIVPPFFIAFYWYLMRREKYRSKRYNSELVESSKILSVSLLLGAVANLFLLLIFPFLGALGIKSYTSWRTQEIAKDIQVGESIVEILSNKNFLEETVGQGFFPTIEVIDSERNDIRCVYLYKAGGKKYLELVGSSKSYEVFEKLSVEMKKLSSELDQCSLVQITVNTVPLYSEKINILYGKELRIENITVE